MKKVLAILMCLSMVLCFMPTIAFAEGVEIVTTEVASAQNEVQNGNDVVAGSEDGGNTGGAKNPDQGGTGNDNPAPTDNVAKVVKTDATATEYLTLEKAVTAAEEDDVIEVLKDFELTDSISISKKVIINLNSKTITVAIPASGTTQSAFMVNEKGDLTIRNGKILGNKDNDSRAIESQNGTVLIDNVKLGDFKAADGNGGAVYADGGTLKTQNNAELGFYDYDERAYHGNSAMNGGALYAKDARVTLENSRFLGNQSNDGTGNATEYWFGGGAVFLEGTAAKVKIIGCYFFWNTTKDYGGAIHLDSVGSAELKENTLKRSEAYNHRLADGKSSRGGDGGAIYARICKEIVLENNTIQRSFCMSDGAGLNVLGTDTKITLNQNIITDNSAGGRGGGMKLRLSGTSELKLGSGEISSNKAAIGAGIDYTGHNMIPLKMRNVLIIGNQAARGAGIWACPTSETTAYATLGGAIYGNTAKGSCSQGIGKPKLQASGDEVRYEGEDFADHDSFIQVKSDSTTMTVMKRALGGGLHTWYLDEANDRFEEGDAEAAPLIYTNTNKSFGLHGELSEIYQKLAESEAQLIIKDNVASSRGGGIATNSPVEIGLKDADVSVKVVKEWSEDEHPSEVKVDLYRVNADKTEIKLDSNVVLNAENNWSAAFSDLPSKYVDGDGSVQDCAYVVREQTMDGWACRTTSNYDETTKVYSVVLTNVAAGNLTVSKTVTGIGDQNKEFTFEVQLNDETISGTYGDMTFAGGKATFTLKHGECKTAANLPVGIEYMVTESDNSGYTVTKTGDTGVIAANETVMAAFTNNMSGGGYIPTPTPDTKYSLTISKVVAGLDTIPADYAVTATITSKTGTVQTLTLKANEQKTIELPQGEYVISEAAPSVDGYTLTGQNISENNFVLTTGGKSIVITNTYEKDADEPAVDPTPTKPEHPTKPEEKTEVPKTGDNSALAGSALLLLLSACGIAAALRRKEEK